MRRPDRTVQALVQDLRGIVGHLGPRDRRLVVEAVDGLENLALQLYAATHPGAVSHVDDHAAAE